ncbi:hypothetical protein LTR85_000921 [Meristemomyces frigidus]|nr:hypothetical protein LTR85_000921 [Meristemomyces frigidus]
MNAEPITPVTDYGGSSQAVSLLDYPSATLPELPSPDLHRFPTETTPDEKADDIQDGSRARWPTLWRLEIASATLSILCIVCLSAILYRVNGKPYHPWRLGNVHISPNTLLSIVSTVSKASFLLPVTEALSQLKWTYFQQQPHRVIDFQRFDDAGRGPLGALKLLWVVKVQAVVASCGAIIMILALATEPFTQQILSYPSIATNATNGTATIGATRIFDAGVFDDESDDLRSFAHSMPNAMLQGLYASSLDTEYNCPGGTCYWPLFDTLGICNSCRNVTQELELECDGARQTSRGYIQNNCSYLFPSGDVVSVLWQSQFPSIFGGADAFSPTPLMHTTVSAPQELFFPFANFSSIQWHAEYAGNLSAQDMDLIKPNALECVLTWCAQRFASTSCRAGTLYDVPTSAANLTTQDPETFGNTSSSLAIGWPASEPSPPASIFNSTQWSHAFNATQFTMIPGVYAIAKTLGGNLRIVFKDNFAFTLQGSTPELEWLLQVALQLGNIPQLLDDVATSLTKRMRSGPNSTAVFGTVQSPVTYVHVNWAWLSNPSALALLAALFLSTSIFVSPKRDELMWKSSSLPLLYHGLDKVNDVDIRSPSLANMKREARKTWVQLADDGSGVPTLARSPALNRS